ncbi:TonB-dependent receptor [Labilibacter marinus]|uniref:TonB-dependent receptor n=1 Tax=Labilibacter marinus TaxID=1477105 RepID=UPI00082FB59B|nr:TonB-dependent receptor [Labilibacter marinus]
MRKSIILIMGLLCLSVSFNAQELSQTIRGKIVDADNKMPLIGAAIVIQGSHPIQGTITGLDGTFRLEKIPVGRVNLHISFMGYEDRIVSNLTLTSGKEVVLNLELKESLHSLNEIVVNGSKKKGETINQMALISAQSFTVEESERYAGSLSDPSRMVSSFAGVTNDPSGNNDIIIRGNSPTGLLWQMEGVPIPNPNHFSDEGTTGGPINALNSSMLANSDFFTGAFAPEYGNAMSGVFDIKLRTGNNEKRENIFGFGVLGTDITTEGPIKKGYGGSYLVNYRYSSLSLLSNLGLVDFDGIPKYQDASFKLCLPTKKAGSFCLFGLGGNSSIEEHEEDNEEVIRNKGKYKSYMGVMGVNHMISLGASSYLKSSLAVSANGSEYSGSELENGSFRKDYEGTWDKSTVYGSIKYNNKFSAKSTLSAGLNYSQFFYDMRDNDWNSEDERWERLLNFKENEGFVQSYASWKYRLNTELTMVTGLHYSNFLLNNADALEPRMALKWQFSPKQSFNFGAGMHSKLESITAYHAIVTEEDGSTSTPNKNLELSKSNHFVLGYEHRLSNNLNAKLEVYYQHLYDIPVENVDTSYFSLINLNHGYVDKALVNKGTGQNYGIELTLERYFNDSYYFMLTSSLYNSTYQSLEGVKRNTRFNGNYAINVLGGKEFKVGKNGKNNTLGVNGKLFWNGGRRYVPLDREATIAQDAEVWMYDQAFDDRLDHIFQCNLTMTYKINRKKVAHEFFLDVVNLTNNQARISEYYNDYNQEIEYSTQLSMLPNFMYRIYF